MKEEEEEVGKRRRVGVDPREEGPRWGGGGGGGRCSRAMNYAVGRGLGPRQAWRRRRRRGEGTLFEVVTSEIRRKREGECKREREKGSTATLPHVSLDLPPEFLRHHPRHSLRPRHFSRAD